MLKFSGFSCIAEVVIERESFNLDVLVRFEDDRDMITDTPIPHSQRCLQAQIPISNAFGTGGMKSRNNDTLQYMAGLTGSPFAFRDLSALGNLQVMTLFALRCVLHRSPSRDIHR